MSAGARKEATLRADFSAPQGSPALYAPDSVSWQVFKNPVSLFIGGIAAVLLELAEPRVRSGVWGHSIFPTDPLTRIRRTGFATHVTIYAPAQTAERLIRGVVRMHDRVEGSTPAGQAYRANDPQLLDWVQTTVTFGFMEAYSRFVRRLSDAEREQAYAESEASARLFGAVGAPTTLAGQQAAFEAMHNQLEPHTIITEFLGIMKRTPALPAPLRPLQKIGVRAGVDLLPSWVIDRLELGPEWRLKRGEETLLRTLGRIADRIPIPGSPPVEASRRMGLPGRYLYRG